MKVSIAQIDIAYGNVSKNYERTANALQKALANHPDVIVLPEMWNTSLYPKIKTYNAFAKNCNKASNYSAVPAAWK